VRRPIRNVLDVRDSYFPDSAAPSIASESENKSNGPSGRIPLMKKVGVCSAIIQSGITQPPLRARFVVAQRTGPDSFAAKQGLYILDQCWPEILWRDDCRFLQAVEF
jgi:hypothetical protein